MREGKEEKERKRKGKESLIICSSFFLDNGEESCVELGCLEFHREVKGLPLPGLATSISRGKTGEGKKARETCNTWHAY